MLARLSVAATALVLLTAPAMAQNLPPAGSMPLSQILAQVEQEHNVRAFTEIEWEDDGYWDIDYVANDSNRVRGLRINPNGQPWSRRG